MVIDFFRSFKETWLTIFRYITGPSNVNDEQNPGKVPRVFINTDVQIEECNLIVYKALSASVCLLVDGKYVSAS